MLFRSSIEVIKAEAWLNNHETTDVFDMKPLMHMLWKEPAHIDTVRSIVLGLVDPLEKQIMDLSDNYRKAIAEWERSLCFHCHTQSPFLFLKIEKRVTNLKNSLTQSC